MIKRFAGVMFSLALTSGYALAAEPGEPEGEPFEILTIALELGARCGTYRGFEFTAIDSVASRAFHSSEASKAASAARENVPPGDNEFMHLLHKKQAGDEVLARYAAQYKQKAEELTCETGLKYLLAGLQEAYLILGAQVAVIRSTHPPTSPNPAYPPLSEEEEHLLQAFIKVVHDAYGGDLTAYEQMIGQLAMQALEPHFNNPATARDRIKDDANRLFARFYADAAPGGAGWNAQGTILPNDRPFGYRTVRFSKDDAAEFVLLAPPRHLSVNYSDGSSSVSGYMMTTRRSDGALVVGLGGGTLGAVANEMTVRARALESRQPPVFAQRAEGDCPYKACFEFPPADILDLIEAASADTLMIEVLDRPDVNIFDRTVDGESLNSSTARTFLTIP